MLEKPKEVIKNVSNRMDELKEDLRKLYDAVYSGTKEIAELVNSLGSTYTQLEKEHDDRIKSGATTALDIKEFKEMLKENINSTFRHFQEAFTRIGREISDTVSKGLDDTTEILEVKEETLLEEE